MGRVRQDRLCVWSSAMEPLGGRGGDRREGCETKASFSAEQFLRRVLNERWFGSRERGGCMEATGVDMQWWSPQ